MRTLLLPFAASFAFALVTTSARAQDAKPPKEFAECARTPTASDVAAAKGAFEAGKVSFDEADYERAIFYWEDAYRRDCTADALLWNLARAYELHGQKANAISALRAYLTRKPDQREQIERRIQVLTKQLETEEEKARAAATQPAPAQPPSEPAPAPPSGADSKPFPWGPVAMMGGGGLVFLVSGALFLDASADVTAFEERCGPTRNQCPPGDEGPANDARDRQFLTGALSIAGIAVAGGGLVWWLVSDSSAEARAAEQTTRAKLTPEAGLGYAGLSFSGSF
jgi:tetratricopeptide (TPR) repeat protein